MGMATEEADAEQASKWVAALYKSYGIRAPNYYYVADSPLSAAIMTASILNPDDPGVFPDKELSHGGLGAHGNLNKYVDQGVRAQLLSKFNEVDVETGSIRDGTLTHAASLLQSMEWSAIHGGAFPKEYPPLVSAAHSLEKEAYYMGNSEKYNGSPMPYDRNLFYKKDKWGNNNLSTWNVAMGRTVIRERIKEQYLGNQMAATMGVYDFVNAVLGVPILDETYYKMNLAQHVGWWSAYQDFVVLQHRPSEIHFNEDGILHNGSGMAIKYRDGFGVYYWRGNRMEPDDEWIIHSPEKININSMRDERNTETRRMMLEQMGNERFFEQTDSNVIDWDDRNLVGLYELRDTPWGNIQVTKSTCHTTGREYVEFLGDQRFDTVVEALNWQFNVPAYNPEQQS